MIGGESRTARRIAGGGTGAPENALSDAQNGLVSSLGRTSRPPRRIPHGLEVNLLGESPYVAVGSQDASQMGNAGWGMSYTVNPAPLSRRSNRMELVTCASRKECQMGNVG